MFYIVETQEQLEKIIDYGNERVFIDIIPVDDRVHPCINSPSLMYFRPLDAKRGFILCFDHLETFSLDYHTVMASVIDKIPQIYTIDSKTLYHYGFCHLPVKGLKMAYKMESNYPEFPDSSKYNTQSHKFYYSRLKNRTDVNKFIPVSKHYEKYENLFESLIIDENDLSSKAYKYYNEIIMPGFYEIERNGIGTGDEFDAFFNSLRKELSVKNNIIYSDYNFHNQTARPSCTFNGFNFLGLKKDDSRKSLVPKNDMFIEIDYKSYQVKLLAEFLEYEFSEEDIHDHLAELYGETDRDIAKRLTFKYLYGRSEDPPDIPFFKRVYELRDYLWEQYQEQGYILSPITKRKIFGITEITQILPYLMHCIETETNAQIIYILSKALNEYKTKLVLYTYDAFLFDISYDDGPEILEVIKEIIGINKRKFTMSYGATYGDLILYS